MLLESLPTSALNCQSDFEWRSVIVHRVPYSEVPCQKNIAHAAGYFFVAVAGSLLLSQSVLANTKPVRKISSSSLSGLSTGETLPLTHTEIPGFLSAEQLQVHHDKRSI
jgi:hypothetical protein